jgi:hypothetical protein
MVNRDLALAATTATATTTLAVFTTTVVQYDQFVHGIHLLSYRRLSIDLVKKIGEQRANPPILLVNYFYQFLSSTGFRREFDHQLSTTDHDIFLIERVERLLAFLADVDQTCIAQNGKMM